MSVVEWLTDRGIAEVVPPVTEPLTLDAAKLRAGLAWPAGDPRDALMQEFIAAARAKVESDTARALATQTQDVHYGAVQGDVLVIPPSSLPLQSVTSITTTTDGIDSVLDPATYTVDLRAGRIDRVGDWPTEATAWVVRIVCGYAAASVPPLLLHAMGLLVAHYATLGRDLAITGTIVNITPQGYDDAIAAYQPVVLI